MAEEERKAKANEAKAKGNTAFSAKDYQTAIKHFTEGIELDPTNHILYSNRSACYASLEPPKWTEALNDANKTVEIAPKWAKGYSRKGAAHYGLGQLREAQTTYMKGLEIEPENQQLIEGLSEVRNAMSSSGLGQLGQLFKGDVWGKIRSHPKLSQYADQSDFKHIVTELQQNPQSLAQHLNDPRVGELIAALLNINLGQDQPNASQDHHEPPTIS